MLDVLLYLKLVWLQEWEPGPNLARSAIFLWTLIPVEAGHLWIAMSSPGGCPKKALPKISDLASALLLNHEPYNRVIFKRALHGCRSFSREAPQVGTPARLLCSHKEFEIWDGVQKSLRSVSDGPAVWTLRWCHSLYPEYVISSSLFCPSRFIKLLSLTQ